MTDGVYIVNEQNEILYVNPVLEKEFGPIKQRPCHEYFYDLPEACSWCKKNEVFAGKTVRWSGIPSKPAEPMISPTLLSRDRTGPHANCPSSVTSVRGREPKRHSGRVRSVIGC